MARPVDDLELRDAFGQCADDLLSRFDRCDRVERADRDERRRRDLAELIDDVESAHELHAARVELEVLRRVSPRSSSGTCGPNAAKDASPLLVGHLLAGVAAPRDLRDLVARDAAEPLDHPRHVPPCESRLDDEPGRMSGVARAVEQDDRSAHRVSEDDRSGYPDRVAEDADVVRARLEAPGARVAPVRPSVPAQIEVDDLGMLRERPKSGLKYEWS